MITLRLARHGRKKNPFYQIVAIDKKKRVGGKPKETIGYWHPSSKNLQIDEKRAKFWKDHGATYSHAVQKLISSHARTT